jgi:ParB family chromosome partitioning protein
MMSKSEAPPHGSGLRWVQVSDVVKWDRNPKEHGDQDVPAIAGSIRRFGFADPITVWGSRRQIVSGHGRILAAEYLLRSDPGLLLAPDAPGPGMVPARWMEFASEAEAAAFAISANRHTERNPMDPAAVTDLLREYGLGEHAEDLGYTPEEIEAMFAPTPDDGAWAGAMDGLPNDDRKPFRQMTFTLHDTQAEQVMAALKAAIGAGPFIDTGNENSNGNALARICQAFLERT